MTGTDPGDFAPRRPALIAALVCLVAAATLCWPMVTGQFLVGPRSDMFEAGYSFRVFSADFFRQHHAIPLWNPYLMGGVPYVAAGAGDIFYPTAWLRWFLPTDLAINLGFFGHIALAGFAAFGLLRVLRVSWAGALVGGLAYELTGIVVSLVHPGHDGKLFVSAMAPILLMGIVLAVRDRAMIGYGLIALATGLSLQGHPQASYYLLVAGGVWGLFWVFGPEGPRGAARWRVVAGSAGAVLLGVGLYAVYLLPMLEYVPHSPRADGGYNTGWQHAISFALPPEELIGLLLPKVDGGVTPGYFGRNGLKLHTEYLGPVVLALAALGLAGPDRRSVRIALGSIAILFLLVSLGGHTPFFRLWYEVMPMMQRLRASGMAFFLVALPVACFAGLGAERLFRGGLRLGPALGALGVAILFGLLGLAGILQTVSEDIASGTGYAGALEQAIANAPALRLDALRLVAVAAVALGIVLAIGRRKLVGPAAVGALALVVTADLWMVGRGYFVFSPPASVTYALDPIMTRLRETPVPYRVYGPAAAVEGLNPYPKSWLMSAGIPTLFGYHGNQLRYFDEVLGGKNRWQNQLNPNLWNMFAVRFIVLNQPQEVPGFRQVLGPVETRHGPGYLYQADTVPPYARVVAGAAKVPDDQLAATVADPRFPVDRLAVFSDTAAVAPADLGGAIPPRSTITATVAEWRAGAIRVTLEGASSVPEYLVISENWYPDWRARIDGVETPVHRAQGTLLGVVIPPGAKEVAFQFVSTPYRRGRLISLLSLAGVIGLLAATWVRRRPARDA